LLEVKFVGLHVVLYQPEIPANTGNIARTCAATGTTLHLIRPLGFSTDDKMLKRAGLDYWEHVNVIYHDSLEEVFDKYKEGNFYFITKFGQKTYSTFDYSDANQDYFFVFGRETNGLPKEIIQNNMERCLRIPMNDKVRALNLSNTAAILVYEALRQQNFPGLS
jgi:tRNA (cytidine/uridine-2'-O-)-methyltransferase